MKQMHVYLNPEETADYATGIAILSRFAFYLDIHSVTIEHTNGVWECCKGQHYDAE
jgi:hypothetical protein